ncbi:glucose-1-phosphate adenylyltransferase [Echinimonas agarilytica]|uniref:Glucose-1-phosphate adenylyltransferase n=1 Tax=Echinimonas agarilytica TaxID=1215918 RepID=A0AA42B8J4_9GAMM|nr:glucose-1-phosphate adenylyltransferase [Echinimonas agarilytica]MCM2680947.1 glucose-1-phosphate adenylyltransferase [Echinimonas agarilytica]
MRHLNKPAHYINEYARESIAFVLAGGRGTRLGSLTRVRAKPATPFGGKYRIIDFTMSNCINSGIRRVGVMTQYNALGLISHLQRTWGHLVSERGEFVSLLPAHLGTSNNWYTGTADAIYQNLTLLEHNSAEYVVILAGDHVYSMNYLPMIEAHAKSQSDVTIACIETPAKYADQFGVVQTNHEGTITQFVEKPKDPSPYVQEDGNVLASMGIYVFSRKALIEMLEEDHQNEHSSHDFGNDILPKALHTHKLSTFRFRDENGDIGYWRDVGTIEAYYDASMELVAPVPRLNLYDNQWPVWTYQEQLPPVKLTHDSEGQHASARDSLISAGSVFVGSRISRSLCCYNVRIDAGSEVHQSILLPNVHVGKNCVIHHAIIDEGCEIPDGIVIGEDAEDDSNRFSITENGVVLVTRETLENL